MTNKTSLLGPKSEQNGKNDEVKNNFLSVSHFTKQPPEKSVEKSAKKRNNVRKSVTL